MTGNSLRRARLRLLAGLAVCLAWPAPAFSQQIEDIIVTARKREESLQEVPLSITALGTRQLQERGITNNYDLALFTPNFNTAQTVGRTLDRPTIRGMANPSVGGEANASYFIDGVFVASSISTATTDVMERVEVLRGPQSAQFGRATFSGAVNYVTRKPPAQWQGEVNAKAGSDEDYKLSGWVGGPLIEDRLGILVSAAWVDFGGAWSNNLRPVPASYNPNGAPVGANTPDPAGGYAYTAPFPPVSDLNFVNPPAAGDQSSIGGEKTQDVLVKLTWTPSDATEINFKYSYTKGDDEHWPSLVPPLGQEYLNCYLPGDPGASATTPGAFCGTFDPTGWENRINIPDFAGVTASALNSPVPLAGRIAQGTTPGTRRETNRVLVDLRQAFGDWELTARAAYNDDDFNQAFDLDHTNVRVLAGLFHFDQIAPQKDYAFEVRVATPTQGRVRGSLGVYYFNYERDSRVRSLVGPYVALGAEFECPRPDNNPVCAGPGPHYVTTDYPPPIHNETENVALFGSVDWDITERLTLALEARWADDRKDILGGNAATDSTSTTAFTPRVTLRYQATDDLMVYGLIAKGNKPASYNDECYRYDVRRSSTQTCRDEGLNLAREEEQWTYEIGLKSSWFDRRLTVNYSGFYIDWDNQTLFTVYCTSDTIGGTELCSTIRTNAGSTKIGGLELETNFAISDNLFLIANYGYQYGEFKKGSDPLREELTGDGDIAGNEIPFSPNHSGTLGFVATNQLTATLEGFIRADYLYESERWVQAANINKLPERKIVNLRVGVESDRWKLTGYVNNLTNNDAPFSALDFFDFGRTLSNGETPKLWSLNPQRGRNVGVEVQYRFGG